MAKKPNALACEPAGRHVWIDPFDDGDTCTCGRFYLTLTSVLLQDGEVIAELTEREPEEEE